jgi:transcriptional regulator with XRE-family HTH domain
MSLQTKEEFIKWLDSMEAGKGWTDYRLSAETGLSSSVFSKARQGILPKWDALMRIANAFGISPITAFRKAGLLPPGPDEKINLEDWEYLLTQMTEEERGELMQIGAMKIERRQKQEGLKSLKSKKAG